MSETLNVDETPAVAVQRVVTRTRIITATLERLVRRQRQWWIKERDNPQLGTYWVACGQLSKTAARRIEGSLYGMNLMHGYDTEEAYNARLAQLRKSGERVQ